MRIPLPLVVGLLTISGCGGGKTAAPVPTTGTLEAGKVRGVHYQTLTQSGTTDTEGTFRYLPGETVTFSIGGVALGGAPGNAQISLFTLAGLAAPANEVALRHELERARRGSTPLVRAMNLARLLIALDADSNPDNGIDVSGRAGELAGKHLDLALGLYPFAASLDRLAPNLTRNIPMERTLVFAYQASNLTVATHIPVRHEVDDGLLSQRTSTITYLPSGARSGEESIATGLGFSSSITSYSYDALGRTAGVTHEAKLDPDRVSNRYRSTTSYDARGNRVTSGYERELFESLVYRTTTDGAADERGLFPQETTTIDSDGDGTVDSRQVTQSNFDANGNPVSSSTSIDNDDDGVIDSRYFFTDTFDTDGRLDTEVFTTDNDADGVIDLRAVTTVAEDGPRAIVRIVEEDSNFDGVIDFRSTTRYVYDAAGNNTLVTILDQLGPDDTVYAYAEFTMTYDGDQRILTRRRTQAEEQGGVPYSTDSSTNVYDAQGNLTRATTEYSGFGGGPGRLVTDYEYGPNGERTMFRHGTDFDADGMVDFESTTQITNQQINDGVQALAQQYFDFAGVVSVDYTSGGAVTGVRASDQGGF